MDLKQDTQKPNVTDVFSNWQTIAPLPRPAEEIPEHFQNPHFENIKPDPVKPTVLNEWYTIEPKTEAMVQKETEQLRQWIIDHTDNPEEEMAKLRTSRYLANQAGVDANYVYQNFEDVTKEYYGQNMNGITAWQSIMNSRKTGQITSELADLYYQKMWGDDSEETQQRIDELQTQMPSLDEQKRSLPVRALKSVMEMAPMMGDIMLEGAMHGVMAGAGGAVIAAAAGNLGPQVSVPEEIATVPAAAYYMYAMGQGAGSAMASTRKEAGLSYMDMIQSGIPEDTARNVAMVVGAINGSIEVIQIASIPGLSDGMKKALQTAAQKGVERAIAGNGVKKLAWEFGKRYTTGIVSETSQELVQETVSFMGEVIASEMEDIDAPGKEEYIETIKQTAIQSALGFGVMALPGSVINSDTAAVIREMRRDTPSATIKTESGNTVPAPKVGQFRSSETSVPLEIDSIQSLAPVSPNSKEYKMAREQYRSAKAGEGALPPIRVIATEDGYIAVDEASLQVALEEGEVSVEVEVIQGAEGPKEASGPKLVAQTLPPVKEDWQKTSIEFTDTAIEANKEVAEFRNVNTLEDLTANVRAAFPETPVNEVHASVALVEAFATARGENVNSFIMNTFAPTVFTREKVIDSSDSGVQRYKAAAKFLPNGKALIHLTEQSDLSSWIHEFGHIIRPQLKDSDQKILLDHYKTTEWTRDAEEKFTKDYEDYLFSGNAPSYELREIFRRIQEALKKIWARINRTMPDQPMPDEVRGVFDRIFRTEESPVEIDDVIEDYPVDHSLDNVIFQDLVFEDSDGVAYIKHEEGFNYDGQKRKDLETEIEETLDTVRENTEREPGSSDQEGDHYTGSSSVRKQWERFKRVDFTGHRITSYADIAEMFSVYRNPLVEYFHIIYTKGDKILAHNAMSSGLPGVTMGTDRSNWDHAAYRMQKRMERLGADGYYLLHNHPSGNVDPSDADKRLTKAYSDRIDGYKGHIILDHTTYSSLNEDILFEINKYIPKVDYSIDRLTPTINSAAGFAGFVKDKLSDEFRSALIYVDGKHRVMAWEPVKKVRHDIAYQQMRAHGATAAVLVTNDQNWFEITRDLDTKYHSIDPEKGIYDVFLDLIYISDDGKITSAVMKNGKPSPFWQQFAQIKKNKTGRAYAWENEVLYQSEEHEEIVRKAVEEFKPVPKAVLDEYAYTDWGQKEIKRRGTWKKYEWLEGLAVGYDDWQELKSWFQDHGGLTDTNAIKDMGSESADRFYKELWMRANRKTRVENNKAFIKQFANKEGVMALASEIASDPHSFKGRGVPGPLFSLKAAMMGKNGINERTFKAAITSVKNNPTEIRRAFALTQGDEQSLEMILFEDEMEDMTPLEEKVKNLTPKERIYQALDTKDPELRKTLISGDSSENSLHEMLKAADRKINTLKAQHTKETNKLKEELGWKRGQILSLKETLEKKIKEARDAKNAAELEQLELIKTTRAEMRGNWKKRREIELTKDKMRAWADNIMRKPSKYTIHVDYQREIIELQNLLHPGFRRKSNAEAWFKKSEFYNKYPAALDVLRKEDIEKITKKPLNFWSMEELAELNEKVNKLRDMGREALQEKLDTQEREKFIKVMAIAKELGNSKIAQAPNVPHTDHNTVYKQWLETGKVDAGRIESWRPSRLLRAMGGPGGTMEKYFWREINKHTDAELKMVQKRQGDIKERMKELGIKMKDLQRPCEGLDGPFPVNDVLQWYIVQGNEKNMKALEFGVGVDPTGFKYYFDQLTDAEKALADSIAKDFEDNYDRYAKAYAEDKNEIMGKTEGGYFPMRRLRILKAERDEDVARDLVTSQGLQKGYAGHKGTNTRIEIADEHQEPIKLGAIDLWMQEVVEQEHYINSAMYIKEMQRVVNDEIFKTAITDKHGTKMLDWIQKYVNEFANPTLYKMYDSTTNIFKTLRNNLAIAYLSCNMMTVAKQFPSVALFLGRTNPIRLTAAAGKFMTHPFKWVEFVNERDPQMKERSMDRVFEELKQVKNSKWDRSIKPSKRFIEGWQAGVKKWGELGMAPITMVDKMATTIGWLAVYDENINKVGEDEAIRLAQEAVLETQPAARAKDLAQMYRSSEGLNWFLMFTNQINQTWNIITADIPAAVQAKQLQKAFWMISGMMVSFAGIAVLSSSWKPWEDDDPEEFAKNAAIMFSKGIFNTVPLAGGSIVSGYEGWMGSGVDPVPAASEIGRLFRAGESGDEDRMLKAALKVAETTAVMTAMPIMPVKRTGKAMKALSEEEYMDAVLEALGYNTGEDYRWVK